MDASGGPLVTNVGHGREEVARVIHDPVLQVDYVHPTMFTTQPIEDLWSRMWSRHSAIPGGPIFSRAGE